MTFIDEENEKRISEEYKSLRLQRRDNKKSIKILDDGTKLTSVVYTCHAFAKTIIDYFSPQFKEGDSFLDPCRGHMAFYDQLPSPKDWCEIQEDRDFLEYDRKVSWTFCNLPWRGRLYSDLARKSFQVSDNVVSLVKFATATGTRKRWLDARNNNMFIKEIIFTPWEPAGFVYGDGTKKGAEGFLLSIIHWQRGWNSGTTWSDWTKDK